RLPASALSSFFFSSRRRHTRSKRDWSSDVCSSDLQLLPARPADPQLQRGAPARRARLVAGAGSADGRHRPTFRAVFVAVITRPSAHPAPSAGTAVDSHTTRLGGRKLFSGGSRAAGTYGHVKRVHSTRV